MAQIPSFKRIFYTDFDKQFQPLVQKLSYTINQGFETLFNALNKGLTLQDNLSTVIKDINVSVDASGNTLTATGMAVGQSAPIQGLMVVKAASIGNSIVYPTSGIFISYTQTNTNIILNNITGLPANTQFTIRVVAFLN